MVSFLDDLYDRPDPKTVNINHVFQVKKESAHIGYRQEFHGKSDSEHNYKKNNEYSNAQSKRRFRKKFKHLKQIEKPKIRIENRATLAKFRRFVVPEDQDYWMYQDPSEDDVKIEKETSKKRKEIREAAADKIQ